MAGEQFGRRETDGAFGLTHYLGLRATRARKSWTTYCLHGVGEFLRANWFGSAMKHPRHCVHGFVMVVVCLLRFSTIPKYTTEYHVLVPCTCTTPLGAWTPKASEVRPSL